MEKEAPHSFSPALHSLRSQVIPNKFPSNSLRPHYIPFQFTLYQYFQRQFSNIFDTFLPNLIHSFFQNLIHSFRIWGLIDFRTICSLDRGPLIQSQQQEERMYQTSIKCIKNFTLRPFPDITLVINLSPISILFEIMQGPL